MTIKLADSLSGGRLVRSKLLVIVIVRSPLAES